MRMLSLLAAGLLLVACGPAANESSGGQQPAAPPAQVADVTNAPAVPPVAEDPPTPEEQALSDVATAPTYEEPFLLIDDVWASPPPSGTNQAAVYLTITNSGLGPDLLTAAETPIAGRAMLHGHVMDGDVARMEERSEIEIPARGAVTLQPGGDHIMLTEVSAPLTEGERFALTLTFERAGSVDITVKVESLASRLVAQESQELHDHH